MTTGKAACRTETARALESRLSGWSENWRSFHDDRNLADAVLLACGWRCLPDPGYPGRVKWEYGTNPVYTSWEPHHPHPINSLDAALGQVHWMWRVCKMQQFHAGEAWLVKARRTEFHRPWSLTGMHPSLAVAACIVAVATWGAEIQEQP